MPTQVARNAAWEEFIGADGDETVYDFEGHDEVPSQSYPPQRAQFKSTWALGVDQASKYGDVQGRDSLHFLDDVSSTIW